MNDPYLHFTDYEVSNWRSYYEYFRILCLHTRTNTLKKRELLYLSYFVKHPVSSAYDIEPGRKTNQSKYRYAKLALNKFHRLKLIKVTKLEKKKKNQRYPTKKYSLTDHGVFFLISHTKISRTELLQELFKNYHDLNIFQYLVYPFMNLETLLSPMFDFNSMMGVGKYLVNLIGRMDRIVLLLQKRDRSDKEIYFWRTSRLESYLRNSHHCDFVDTFDSEEVDTYDGHHEITYFDKKNKNNYVTVRFDMKNKRAYILRKNRRFKKYEIPLISDYVATKLIPYNIDAARYFHAFCAPRVEEFVLSVSPFFEVTTVSNVRDLTAADRKFRDALKVTKDRFDIWYGRITSFPNFSF